MTNDPIIDTAVKRLIDSGLANSSDLEGCTESEIAAIENSEQLRLPRIYRAFLARMGRKAGVFLRGTDYSCSKLASFRSEAKKLVQAFSKSFALSPQEFVFLFHQGHTFLYFDCTMQDDPPIYMFTESEDKPTRVFDHFSTWLDVAIGDDVKSYQDGLL